MQIPKSTKINDGKNINIVSQIENAERINKKSTCIISPSFSVNDDLGIDGIALRSIPHKVSTAVRNTSGNTIKISKGD